ncbi:hypothetical protein Pla52o_28610 [Novipirellula galeiformis]|uniref:Uncharacterized protein n=1 Tax=Novipirellula galeiformis TaxID=2528004 RepID=A0A5C6CH26_9BACT|nr:hypothetical protein Pla52o_28610 [Novipirellula galeiformis]
MDGRSILTEPSALAMCPRFESASVAEQMPRFIESQWLCWLGVFHGPSVWLAPIPIL